MSWEPHTCINNITAKANKILGFLKRNLQIRQEDTKSLAYKSMVRSNLEYCSTVWSPHTKKLKDKLENVQRWAAHYVTHRYHNTSSVSDMLHHLNWPSLEQRRNLSRLSIFYKITHNLVAINPNLYLIPQTSTHTRKTSPLHFQHKNRLLQIQLFSTHCNTMECITTHCCISHLFGSVQNPGPKHLSIIFHSILYILFLLALYILLALF